MATIAPLPSPPASPVTRAVRGRLSRVVAILKGVRRLGTVPSSPHAHDPVDSELDEMLAAAQFRALRHQVPSLHLILLINVTFLTFITSSARAAPVTYLPSCVLACSSAVRILKWRRVHYAGAAAARRMFASTVRTSLLFGLSLSAWSAWVLYTRSADVAAFIPFFAALSTIACAVCMVSLPRAAYAVIWSGTVPMVVAMIATGNPALMAAAANLSVIAVLLFAWMQRQHQQFHDIVQAHATTIEREREVAHLAFNDQLTGLANRRAFLARLDEAQRPAGERLDTTVVLMDLDGFKAVNDRLGHGVGDVLLRRVSDRLAQHVPPQALCARLGGDEFAVLLPTADAAKVAEAAQRIAAIFDQPITIGDDVIQPRGSIGLSTGDVWPGDPIDLMHRADLALYESKALKQAQPYAFHIGLQQQSDRRRIIETAYQDPAALAQLDVHFQPIVRTGTGEVVAFEALMRWQHPHLGNVPPDELFAVADRARVATHFTDHLFARALAKATQWPSHLALSFNVTAGEVGPHLCAMVAAACERHGFPLDRLIVEITETALLRDLEVARRTIAELQALGVRVALDDFGAGFASIGYLKHIRFDLIKIDGGLVQSIAECPLAGQLLIGVVELCRAVGTPIVVEQVETQAQLDILRVLGVDKVQGYLLGHPTADPDLTAQAPLRTNRM